MNNRRQLVLASPVLLEKLINLTLDKEAELAQSDSYLVSCVYAHATHMSISEVFQ